MKLRHFAAFVTLVALGAGAGAGDAAAPRPVELPVPDLPVTVAPLAFGVTRPTLPLPPPPPTPAPAGLFGAAPLPHFATLDWKPLPAVPDPGQFACAFIPLRGAAALADCGVHRALQGEWSGAREALEENAAREPRGPGAGRVQLWLGEVAVQEKRYDAAERHYRTALTLGLPRPLSAHAGVGYGWLALRRGEVAEAQRAFAQAFAEAPPPSLLTVVRFLDAVTRLLAGRPADALSIWDEVAAAGPPAALAEELPFWRGAALARVGEAEKAVEALDRFLAVAPPTHPLRADAEAQAGWVALHHGAPAEAERRFLVAYSLNPRAALVPDLREGLVRVYLALGDSARATAEARRLALDAPRSLRLPALLLLVADDALQRGAVADAIEEYPRLLGLSLPPALQAYASYRLGEALEQRGHTVEAAERYQLLRERGPIEAIAQRATYRLGLMALRAGRPADARVLGESMLRAGAVPELREAALLLAGEGAAGAEDPNRAAALFRRALDEYPTSPRASATRVALGWALFRDNEPQSALREWEKATLASEVEVAARAALLIADVAVRQGHDEQAADALREFARLAPEDPLVELARLNRGVLLVRTRAYAAAVQEIEPLLPRLADAAHRALARRAVGTARYHLGEYRMAEHHFRQAAHWAPAEPSSWLGVGLAALAQKRLAEADDALNRARLTAAPDVAATAAYALLLVAVERQDREAFRDRATQFVDQYPTHPATPIALYGLVVAALEQGDPDGARAWVSRLVTDHPGSGFAGDALFRLAEGARARPDLAREAYREILARLKEDAARADARLGLAEAALTLGDPTEALPALEAFVQEAPANDPRMPRALALLVRAHETQGQREAALRATEQFLARFREDPLAPAIQLTRGHLLLQARQWEPAREALEAALDQGDPAVAAPAQVWLGELERLRGNHEAAIAAYLGATYLYQDTAWAARGLQGAAQSYMSRQMPREAAILLRKLVAHPRAESAVLQWARQTLAQLGPITGEDPAERLRKGAARP